MKRYDEEDIYCRMLGHAVNFQYCRTTADGSPCRKIMDCWFERLPIEAYMKEHFSPDQLKILFKQPESKVTSILDLIEKARKRTDEP
ncbi:MAG: hypothetical protein KKD44_21230 [Proteobacteria bacterium]|nr:hypothetical protein [Pseudomonadota bacterium]